MSLGAFAALTAAVAFYLFRSGMELPATVASHFSLGGAADGFMPRGAYLWVMGVLTLALPWAMALLLSQVRRVPPAWLNLPRKDYWLAPERREETFDYFASQSAIFGAMLLTFLCFVHSQVVAANRLSPPRLDERIFLPGLAVFLVATTAWAIAFVAHFARAPLPPRP